MVPTGDDTRERMQREILDPFAKIRHHVSAHVGAKLERPLMIACSTASHKVGNPLLR